MSERFTCSLVGVEIDLIHKGIKTIVAVLFIAVSLEQVEIDLIHKGIKTGKILDTYRKF